MVTLNQLKAKFAVGHNFLLVNDASKFINTCSIAFDSIINIATQNGIAAIVDEVTLLKKFQKTKLTLIDQIIFYLNLAMCLIEDLPDKEPYLNYLELHKTRNDPFKTPIIIVAGGASLMDKTETETYRDYLRKMMHGFTGTIISGGTTAGIPGLIGVVLS